MTHHGYKHVDEDDNGDHVIKGKQKQTNSFNQSCRMRVVGKSTRISAGITLLRVFNFYAVNRHLAKHGPKEAEQSAPHPVIHIISKV